MNIDELIKQSENELNQINTRINQLKSILEQTMAEGNKVLGKLEAYKQVKADMDKPNESKQTE